MADVVEHSVVGLTYHGIDGWNVLHSGPGDHPLSHCVSRAPHAQRAREEDWSLQLAKLAQLSDAGELAIAVADEQAGGHAIEKRISAMRQDRGHAGVDRI